jgi:hypothetical protein
MIAESMLFLDLHEETADKMMRHFEMGILINACSLYPMIPGQAI